MSPRAAVGIAFAALLSAGACVTSTSGAYRPDDAERSARRAEVAEMLAGGARNWNRGDLDAFVDDYVPGAGTTYIGARGTLRGPPAIRAAYAPRFAPGVVRDSLSFEIVDVDPLGPDVLNAIATYTLSRRIGTRDSVTARGPTSLVMRRIDGRWRIVHDHSS